MTWRAWRRGFRSWIGDGLRLLANRIDPPPSDLFYWNPENNEGSIGGIHVRLDPTLEPDEAMIENPAGGPPIRIINIGTGGDQ